MWKRHFWNITVNFLFTLRLVSWLPGLESAYTCGGFYPSPGVKAVNWAHSLSCCAQWASITSAVTLTAPGVPFVCGWRDAASSHWGGVSTRPAVCTQAEYQQGCGIGLIAWGIAYSLCLITSSLRLVFQNVPPSPRSSHCSQWET